MSHPHAALVLLGVFAVAECIFVPVNQPIERQTSRRSIAFEAGGYVPGQPVRFISTQHQQSGSMRADMKMSANDMSYWSKPQTVSWSSRSAAAPSLKRDTPVPISQVFKFPDLASDLSTPLWKPEVSQWFKTPSWNIVLPNLLKPQDVEVFRAPTPWNFDLPEWIKEGEVTTNPIPVLEVEFPEEGVHNDVGAKNENDEAKKWWKPILDEYLLNWKAPNRTTAEVRVPMPGFDSYWGVYDHLAPAYSYATFHDV